MRKFGIGLGYVGQDTRLPLAVLVSPSNKISRFHIEIITYESCVAKGCMIKLKIKHPDKQLDGQMFAQSEEIFALDAIEFRDCFIVTRLDKSVELIEAKSIMSAWKLLCDSY